MDNLNRSNANVDEYMYGDSKYILSQAPTICYVYKIGGIGF